MGQQFCLVLNTAYRQAGAGRPPGVPLVSQSWVALLHTLVSLSLKQIFVWFPAAGLGMLRLFSLSVTCACPLLATLFA